MKDFLQYGIINNELIRFHTSYINQDYWIYWEERVTKVVYKNLSTKVSSTLVQYVVDIYKRLKFLWN